MSSLYACLTFGLFWVFIALSEGLPGYEKITQEKPNSYKLCDGDPSPDGGQQIRATHAITYLKATYQNCTHIKGHLSLANVHFADLSFLSTIVEVTGSVFIFGNTMPLIPLHNLRVIRGHDPYTVKDRFDSSSFGLFIAKNFAPDNGTAYIDLSSLVSVMKHDVYVAHNSVCNLKTVNWQAIIENPKQQKVILGDAEGKCIVNEKCNESCPLIRGKRYCWGPTIDMCQLVDQCNRSSCDATQARCFTRADGTQRCCHEECVGGCTGISRKECISCRHFLNKHECQETCPPREIYDSKIYQKVPNPKFRFTLGTLCVKKCPMHYLREDESCVKKCSSNSYSHKDACLPCHGNMCDKVCRITDILKKIFEKKPELKKVYGITTHKVETVGLARSILKAFSAQNCSIVDGDVKVTGLSSKLPMDENVRAEDFQHLKNIKRINGQLYLLLSSYPQIKSLDFLSNLESVTSSSTKKGVSIYMSGLEYLGLVNLKNLTVRNLKMAMNRKLCYLDLKTLKNAFPSPELKIQLNFNNKNCEAEGKVCDATCLPEKGCWGPGRGMCFECRQWKAGQECVSKCNDIPGYHSGKGESRGVCKRCHPQCKATCSGPKAEDCIGGCKNAKDGPFCVSECPNIKYRDDRGECRDCAKECFSESDIRAGYDKKNNTPACTGPSARPGPGGCSKCKIIQLNPNITIRSCIRSCPSFNFFESSLTRGYRRRIKNLKDWMAESGRLCIPCHPLCKECYGVSASACETCRSPFYKLGDSRCLRDCDDQTFRSTNEKGDKQCVPCSQECRKGCNGTSTTDCFACRRLKIYLDGKKLNFACNHTCPHDLKFFFTEQDTGDTVCVATPVSEGRKRLAIGIAVGAFLIIFIIIGGIIFMCIQKRRARLLIDRDKLHAKYTRKLEEEGVALHTTDCKPNPGHLRIISAKRLNKVSEIGSGAFGTVFKGCWRPEKEESDELEITIEVAIKELKNTNDKTSTKEFLSEAHVMASVEHPFCMGLLGVCMSNHMQLVSEFMPLGSLSSYLPKHQHDLGSQRLLTWALQIAKGMSYLESRGIVHRDLAARNVLLQNEEQVRITDFGLAKLLDPGGDEIHAVAGKFPVKWLAIESLLNRTFSHKSDVWSYGVTLWEMFTFGTRPYGDLRATEMYDFLESGERLKQPQICTLDLYMLLIKCWLLDPESRPTFSELVSDVSSMAGDPGRFLIIEHDTLRRAPLRDDKQSSDSTSPRVSNLIYDKDMKPHATVQLPPESGVPHIESQLKNRGHRSPSSLGDHYSDNPVGRDDLSSSLPPPPPPPPAPKAGFDELDEADIEEGDFDVEADYLMPNANQSPDDYVPPSPRPTQPLYPKQKPKIAAVPDVEYVNQPPVRASTVHNPNYDSQYLGRQPSTNDDYLVPDDDDYVAPTDQGDQDDYLQPLMANGASRA